MALCTRREDTGFLAHGILLRFHFQFFSKIAKYSDQIFLILTWLCNKLLSIFCELCWNTKKKNRTITSSFQGYNLTSAMYFWLMLPELKPDFSPWEPVYRSLFSVSKWSILSAMGLFGLLKELILSTLGNLCFWTPGITERWNYLSDNLKS